MESLWQLYGAQSSYCLSQRSHFENVWMRTPLLPYIIVRQHALACAGLNRAWASQGMRKADSWQKQHLFSEACILFYTLWILMNPVGGEGEKTASKDKLADSAGCSGILIRPFHASLRQVHHIIPMS